MAKKPKGEGGKEKAREAVVSTTPVEEPRKRKLYKEQAAAELRKQFSFKNPMQVPRLKKITVNMGLGAAVGNPKIIDSAVDEMRAITGQKPILPRACCAVATYKLRPGHDRLLPGDGSHVVDGRVDDLGVPH